MKCLIRLCVATMLAMSSSLACATFHLFTIEQIYSNADGTVQFVVLTTFFNGEDHWAGRALKSTTAVGEKVFAFPRPLPSDDTAGRRVLVGTQGFAALGIVTPDYVIPNNFIPTGAGTVDFAGVYSLAYSAGDLPTDGVNALYSDGSVKRNLATNFAGERASVGATAPPSASNYQGLWWAAGGTESGWGINFAHQGDAIFATWFTYDTMGKAWWLTMTANLTAPGVYSGQLIHTNGAPFSAYTPPATVTAVGNGTLTFTSATTGTFAYTVNDGANVATQTKSIALQMFATVPTCVWGAQTNLTLATNYQDLWWTAGGTESGWGVNLTHQGTTIFATWFTYDANRNPLWLSATLAQTGPKTYSGALVLTGGQAFNALPFDPTKITRKDAGTATFAFTDGNTGTFSYNVDLGDGVNRATQSKAITRQVFRAPGTVCQ
jgi:hypothetical protein